MAKKRCCVIIAYVNKSLLCVLKETLFHAQQKRDCTDEGRADKEWALIGMCRNVKGYEYGDLVITLCIPCMMKGYCVEKMTFGLYRLLLVLLLTGEAFSQCFDSTGCTGSLVGAVNQRDCCVGTLSFNNGGICTNCIGIRGVA